MHPGRLNKKKNWMKTLWTFYAAVVTHNQGLLPSSMINVPRFLHFTLCFIQDGKIKHIEYLMETYVFLCV